MPDAQQCLACGEEHGPTLCRQALALRVADQYAERDHDHAELCSLRLEVTDLRWQLEQRDLTHFHR